MEWQEAKARPADQVSPCSPGCHHVCVEDVFRAERDQARRDLDQKDHEYAAVRAELKAAEARVEEQSQEIERLRFEAEKRGCWECPSKEHRAEAAEAQLARLRGAALPLLQDDPLGRLVAVAHNIDIIVRKDGRDFRFEGDFLKPLRAALRVAGESEEGSR